MNQGEMIQYLQREVKTAREALDAADRELSAAEGVDRIEKARAYEKAVLEFGHIFAICNDMEIPNI